MGVPGRDVHGSDRLEPGEKPTPRLIEGRDFVCGWCAGRRVRACDFCMDGCPMCKGVGEVMCPSCQGGAIPLLPPDWL